VWPFLFSHYPFESTPKERAEIDQTVRQQYQNLIKEWQSAEEIVVKLDTQRSNRRKIQQKSAEADLANTETAASPPLKTILTSIPAKMPSPALDTLQRKDSIVSNEVFYDVTPSLVAFLQLNLRSLGLLDSHCDVSDL
jgi:hypothetical protein